MPCIHPETIRLVQEKMPASSVLAELADFYKLFGDGTRLRILTALSIAELCVCDLSALLDMKQPAVSHQLRVLKQGRVVRARREGKVVYYALNDEHIRNVLQVGLEHLGERQEVEEVF
ncbi:MAG: helix-turn-helix transcriptional regulator [Desulfobacterales bacterium]|nr:helix-turn-helix transcriptional regulator [Desulfobacterales bacterium]